MGKYGRAAMIGVITAFVVAFGVNIVGAGPEDDLGRIPLLIGLVSGVAAFVLMARTLPRRD